MLVSGVLAGNVCGFLLFAVIKMFPPLFFNIVIGAYACVWFCLCMCDSEWTKSLGKARSL